MAKTKSLPQGIPPELAQAIQNSANKYNVPPDLLVGIWHIETGSTFPNPYANGLGYGGEFGTAVTAPFGTAHDVKRIVEPPLQQQADTSASILANLLNKYNGDISQALLSYSGGGYSSVPGQTTTGSWTGAKAGKGKWTLNPNAPGGPTYTDPSGKTHSTPSGILGPIQGVEDSVANAIQTTGLTVGRYILYGFAFIGGTMLLLVGLILIGADLGLSAFGNHPAVDLAKKTGNGVSNLKSRPERKREATRVAQEKQDEQELRDLERDARRIKAQGTNAREAEKIKQEKAKTSKVRAEAKRARNRTKPIGGTIPY